MATATRLVRTLAAFVALGWALPTIGSAETVVVQVKTGMRPEVEFEKIRTQVKAVPSGRVLEWRDHPASAGGSWSRGVRVAEIDGLAPGNYAVLVSALAPGGRTIVAKQVRAELTRRVQVITVVLRNPNPPRSPCKTLFSADKRQCGLALKAWLDATRGERARWSACEETHGQCIAGAKRKMAQCNRKNAGTR
jgi:hypothetical protein